MAKDPPRIGPEMAAAVLGVMGYSAQPGTCKSCRYFLERIAPETLRALLCRRNAFNIPLKTRDGRCDYHEPFTDTVVPAPTPSPTPSPTTPAAEPRPESVTLSQLPLAAASSEVPQNNS